MGVFSAASSFFSSLKEMVPFTSNDAHEIAVVDDHLTEISNEENKATQLIEMVGEYVDMGYSSEIIDSLGDRIEEIGAAREQFYCVIDDTWDLQEKGVAACDIMTTPMNVAKVEPDESKQQSPSMM